MTIFQSIATVLGFAAIASFVNYKFIKLPTTMGLMVMGIIISALFIALTKFGVVEVNHVEELVRTINFSDVLLHSMLGFLLFAGALHVDLNMLKEQKWPIGILATGGVVISTVIYGVLFYGLVQLFGIDIPLIYAFLFGALISPTDPIAVMSIMKSAGAPKSLEMKVTGESMFNDGTGVVLFLALLAIVTGGDVSWSHSVGELLFEVIGGLIFGGVVGFAAFLMLRAVDDYSVEVLITIALVAVGYSLAEFAHVSAPIAIVVAGLVIGNHGRPLAMSDKTREHVDTFWELTDEVLNAILFAMIGLTLAIIPFNSTYFIIGLGSILILLFARFVSVWLPITLLRPFHTFTPGSVGVLTWAGLRGGISIALALTLPPSPYRDMILFVTYIIVIASILGQGLTLGPLIKRAINKETK